MLIFHFPRSKNSENILYTVLYYDHLGLFTNVKCLLSLLHKVLIPQRRKKKISLNFQNSNCAQLAYVPGQSLSLPVTYNLTKDA